MNFKSYLILHPLEKSIRNFIRSVCVFMYTHIHIIKIKYYFSQIHTYLRDLRETHIFKKNDIFIVLHSIQVHNICHHLGKLSSMLIKKILAGDGGDGDSGPGPGVCITLKCRRRRETGKDGVREI